MKKVKTDQLKFVIFTAMKNPCMLHGRVFVLTLSSLTPLLLTNLMGTFIFIILRAHRRAPVRCDVVVIHTSIHT